VHARVSHLSQFLKKRSDPQKYKIKVKPCAVIIDLERALDGSGWIDVRIGHSVKVEHTK
jgi:hypothetical protein